MFFGVFLNIAWGHTYNKKLLVYLKFKFNRVLYFYGL